MAQEPTAFRRQVLDAAGLAMAEIRKAADPAEAQLAIAMMAAYLCSQYEIDPQTFAYVLGQNMEQVARDTDLMPRVIERIHTLSMAGSQVEPLILNSSGAPLN